MAKQITEAEIQKQMKANHCSREEAISIIEWDNAIDAGDKELGAPTPEQKKLVRNLLKADKDPTEKRSVKRERKVDDDKLKVFNWLKITLEGFQLNGEIESLTCKNEAEISFNFNGSDYTVKLTKHRAKKA